MSARLVETPRARVPRFPGPVVAELVKLRCRRTLAWVVVLTVAASAGLAAAMGQQDPAETGGEAAVASLALFAGCSVLPYVAAFLASSSVAAEFGSGVSRAVYSAVPSRVPVIAAKALVAVGVGATLAVLSLVSAATVLALATPVPTDAWLSRPATWAAFAGAVASCSALALVGTAVGTVSRRVQGGVVGLVALLLLAPPLVGALGTGVPLVGDLAQLLPMAAANALVDDASLGGGAVDRPAAAAVLVLWSVVSMVVASWTVRRADL
jgi:ABC-2 type transport system permease protein